MKQHISIAFVTVITCLRFPLAAVIAYLFWRGEALWAVAGIAFGLCTDWIDGPIARALDATTDFGRDKLEPWADTALMTGSLLGLGLGGFLPIWALAVLAFAHAIVEFIIKPRVPYPDRIVFCQAVGMEVGMPVIIALILMREDPWLGMLPPVVGIVVAALKHRRIREFTAWCFRE